MSYITDRLEEEASNSEKQEIKPTWDTVRKMLDNQSLIMRALAEILQNQKK